MKKIGYGRKLFDFILLFISFSLLLLSIFAVPLKKVSMQNYSANYKILKIDTNSNLQFQLTTSYDALNKISINTNVHLKKNNNFSSKKYGQFISELSIIKDILLDEKKLFSLPSNEPYFIIDMAINDIKVIEGQRINFNKVYNDLELEFDEIKGTKWGTIRVDIKCVNCNKENYAYFYANNDISNRLDNNKTHVVDLVNYSIQGRIQNFNYIWIATIIFLLILIKYIKKYYCNAIEKIYNITSIYLYFIEIILSFLSTISLYKLIINCVYYDKFLFYYFIILLLSIIPLFLIIYTHFIKEKNKIEKLYLSISILLSIMMMFFILPNWVSDEDAHFYKTYSVSENVFMPILKNEVPNFIIKNSKENVSNYQVFDNVISEDTDYDDVIKINGLANSYNSALYLLPSLGIKFARIFNLNIFVGYYIARFLNLLLMVICGYYTIKLIPFGKVVTTIYLLSPMYIHQGMSLSIDCFINSFCLLFIAYVLYLKNKDTRISKKQFAILFLLMIAISITKYVYTPINFFAIILLFSKNKKDDRRVRKILLYIILSLFISILLYVGTKSLLLSQVAPSQLIAAEEITPSYFSTILDIIKHPFDYINILCNTVIENGEFYVESFIGTQLGWFTINLNETITYLYLFILIIAAYLDNSNYKFNVRDKVISFLISFIVINVVFLAFYLEYVNYSQIKIHGVQGRYFIPVVLLMIIPFLRRNNQMNNEIRNKLLCINIFIDLAAIFYIIKSFL